jgi:hypothetical protein
MGTFSGPKVVNSGLVLSIDANNQKSMSPLGCTGFSGAIQLVKNLVSSGDVISNTTGVKLDNLTFYTAFAIDYPEGSYGGDAAGRQGITPGFNVRTGTKLYDSSRALHLWVWNNNTSAWVPDSYFHGLRLSGHCYDNYSGAETGYATELGYFVSDYNTIKATFPNCTYIVSGGHRADRYNVTVRNILTDLGKPSGYIDSDVIAQPEWILVGKPGLGAGNAYGWAYQNYPTNTTEVAHLNFGLPIHQGTNNYLGFNGTDDKITTSLSPHYPNTTWEAWVYCTQNISTYNMFMGSYLPYFGFYGGNSLYFSNTISGTQRTIQTPTTLSLNTWYHAAFTTRYDGTNTIMTIYTNGIETATGTFSGQQSAPSGTFTVGDGQNSTWYPFKGNVSNVKVYNRTLSAAEILQNFNAIRSRFGL